MRISKNQAPLIFDLDKADKDRREGVYALVHDRAPIEVQRCIDQKEARLAERVGFEPTLGVNLNQISNLAPSTTRPSLHRYGYQFPSSSFDVVDEV